MSTALYFRPPLGCHPVPGEVKYALAPWLWEHDGSLAGDWRLLGVEDVAFLEGIVAAGNKEAVEGAKFLIAQIAQHGSIEVALIG